MNERQEYALLHPISDARPGVQPIDPYRRVRKGKGLLLMSVLAVDR